MIKKIQYTARFIRYLLKAKHRKGYGVHSPFAFDLITNVFEEKNHYYSYSEIEKIRQELLANISTIDVVDFGTGTSGKRKISEITSRSLKSEKYAQLMFRLANVLKPNIILELGTSFGITTAYLASANPNAVVYSLEGCPQTATIAKSVLDKCKLKNVTLCVGNIDETLSEVLKSLETIDYAFFDANHTKEATLNYFNLCLSKVNDKSVFLFDDIHYSRGMEEAWDVIKNDNRVRVSFDLFTLGIVFFNQELKKQDYIYSFNVI